ncbi:Ent-kaurene oxidase, chloroplastic-like protein, partial [Tanacetum coccineum]
KEASIDIVCGLTSSDDDSKTTFSALSWLIGKRKNSANEGDVDLFKPQGGGRGNNTDPSKWLEKQRKMQERVLRVKHVVREDELLRIEEQEGKAIYWNETRVLGIISKSRAIGDGYLRAWIIHLAVNIYGCNMEKNVWENPEVYNPDRFIKENETIDMQRTMTFGGGKRVCVGSLQAMLISCIGIGRMVQEFEWRFKDKAEEDISTLGLTT